MPVSGGEPSVAASILIDGQVSAMSTLHLPEAFHSRAHFVMTEGPMPASVGDQPGVELDGASLSGALPWHGPRPAAMLQKRRGPGLEASGQSIHRRQKYSQNRAVAEQGGRP